MPARAIPHHRPQYWLLKSEPETFSFDDLWRAPGRRTGWDGVRNYQARNFLRDSVRAGDLALFYHSGEEPGVAGLARVAAAARPDPTQFDPGSPAFDAKSSRAAPTWFEVEIEALARFPAFVPLERLRAEPALAEMLLLQRGQRLSVLPVTAREWDSILRLAEPDAARRADLKSLGSKGLGTPARARRGAGGGRAGGRKSPRGRRSA